MNTAEKKAKLAQWCMTKGIFGPDDQEAKIKELAATYPPASAQEKGLIDVVDIAYEAWLLMEGTSVAPTTSTQVQTQPTSATSDAEKAFIVTKLRGEKNMRQQKTQATKINKLLLGRPAPSEYIPAGTTGVLKVEGFKDIQDKIEKGTYILLPDDAADVEGGIASTTNYNAFLAAVANPEQHPFEVHVGKLSTRPVGYLVDTLDNTGSNATAEQMDRAEFEKFLVLHTAGYINASSANAPGAMLRYIDPKSDMNDPGKVKPGRTVVVDKNKKEAIAAGNYDIVTQVVTGTKKMATGKAAAAFKVQVAGKQTTKGDPVVRTIRPSLSIEIPELEYKVQYADKFEVKKDPSFTEAPDAKTSAKIYEAQVKAIADLTKALGSTDGSLDEYASDIEKFMKPAPQQSNVTI